MLQIELMVTHRFAAEAEAVFIIIAAAAVTTSAAATNHHHLSAYGRSVPSVGSGKGDETACVVTDT
jgi:hypothetical protein